MMMKFYLTIAAISIVLSSCLKQSIADAMLNRSGQQANNITASLSYEINGKLVKISVEDADHQAPTYRRLSCEKSVGYVLSGAGSEGAIVYTFFTDSLKVGSYNYPSNFGPLYVTDFKGVPQYVYGPTDHMNFTVTSYKDGHISGNFSGQLTPAVIAGYPDNVYGTSGSVLIKNGSFSNVPVIY